jgi:hypothetical protein
MATALATIQTAGNLLKVDYESTISYVGMNESVTFSWTRPSFTTVTVRHTKRV